MLTGTLLNANEINDNVAAINTVYPGVHKNLQSVPLALETARVAGEIDKAAEPVGPAFAKVADDVNGIQTSVESILAAGGEINSSVKSINAGVKTINGTAVQIGTTLHAVKDDVHSINASAHGIGHSFDKILDASHGIDDGAAGINRRADTVIDTAKGIKGDLDFLTESLAPGILKNSAAIKGSPLLSPLARGNLGEILRRVNLGRVLGVPTPPVLPPALSGPATEEKDDVPLTGLLGGSR